MLWRTANNATTDLVDDITSTDTEIRVLFDTAGRFPVIDEDSYFVATISIGGIKEIVHVINLIDPDTFTVVRGQEGTTALAWPANTKFENLWTAGQSNSVLQIVDEVPIDINNNWTGMPIAVSHGGTGATTAVQARTNLGINETNIPSVPSVAALSTLTSGAPTIILNAYYEDGATGGGILQYRAGITDYIDDGYRFAAIGGCYERITEGRLTTDDFGIFNDLSIGQAARLQIFFNTCVRERFDAIISSAPDGDGGIDCQNATIYVNNGGSSTSGPIDGIQIRGGPVGGTPPNGTEGGSLLQDCRLFVGCGLDYTDANGNKPDGNVAFVSRGVGIRHFRIVGMLEMSNLQVASCVEQVRVTPKVINANTRGIYAYYCNTMLMNGVRCDNGGSGIDGFVIDSCPDMVLLACADNRSRIGLQVVQEVIYGWTIANVTDDGGLINIETTYPNDFVTGDQEYVVGVVGVTIDPTILWTITVVDSTHVTLDGSTWPGGVYVSGGNITTQPSGTRGSNVTGGIKLIAFHFESNYEEAAIFANCSSGSADVRCLTQALVDWTKPRFRIGHPTDSRQVTTQFTISGDVRGRTDFPAGSVGIQLDYSTVASVGSDCRRSLVDIGVNITANSVQPNVLAGSADVGVNIPVQTAATTDTFPAYGFGGLSYGPAGAPEAATPLASIITDSIAGEYTVARQSEDGTAALYKFQKSRGTPTTPVVVSSGDALGNLVYYGWGGTAFREAGRWRVTVATATPSDTDMEGRAQLLLSRPGTVSVTTIFQLDWTLGVRMFGTTSTVIRPDGALGTPTVLVAALGTPTAGLRMMVSDATTTLALGIGTVVAGTGANTVPVVADGIEWRIG